MRAFSLVGVDGNAYSVMGYTAHALRRANLKDKENEMFKRATSGDYDNLICVCCEYIDMANDALGLTEEYDEDEDE